MYGKVRKIDTSPLQEINTPPRHRHPLNSHINLRLQIFRHLKGPKFKISTVSTGKYRTCYCGTTWPRTVMLDCIVGFSNVPDNLEKFQVVSRSKVMQESQGKGHFDWFQVEWKQRILLWNTYREISKINL